MATLRLLLALLLMAVGTTFGALAISGYYEPHMTHGQLVTAPAPSTLPQSIEKPRLNLWLPKHGFAGTAEAPAAKPLPVPATPSPPPAKPLAPAQGYLVQMGVFSNIANAEDLKGRLDKAGIPAHIEARVQVGPFKNKAEAEAAQKKLAEMGLSGLLLSPRK